MVGRDDATIAQRHHGCVAAVVHRSSAFERDEPDWPEILRRALLYRLGVSVGHPNSTPASMVGMLSAVELLTPLLDR